MMEHLQTLLLPLLLVMWPPVNTNYSWNRREGGGEARTPSIPYLAYLQGKNNHSCGGFLVAPNWVMTAAQCLVCHPEVRVASSLARTDLLAWQGWLLSGFAPSATKRLFETVSRITYYDHKPLTVILGAHTVQRKEENWQKFEVKEYHCHPHFTSPKEGNDILLLKLNGNATSNSYVRTISFEKSRVRGGTVCSVVGYKTPTGTLREATVTIIKQRDCLSHYPGLAENLICGRSRSAEVPEKGDAGDPLVCNNKAYGIFSYRHNNWPGFYTHIAHYLSWVNSVIKSA